MNTAERMDLARVTVLLAELGRLTARERQVRQELAEILEQPRSAAASHRLGKLLKQLCPETQT